MSHSACQPVSASVLGQPPRDAADIARVHQLTRAQSLDLLQTDHLLSGIDIALWDLLGRRHQAPVHALLGMDKAHPKIPYASQLFGDTPQETLEKARAMATHGYQAVKFGWGPYGRASVREDRDQVLLPDARAWESRPTWKSSVTITRPSWWKWLAVDSCKLPLSSSLSQGFGANWRLSASG